jgi:drug/metabolite transporter (DMT)-like permease
MRPGPRRPTNHFAAVVRITAVHLPLRSSGQGVAGGITMQRPTLGIWRYQRAAGLYVIDPAQLTTRSAAVGAALVVGSALAFALDGPVAQAAYRQGLDPAAFGFWRACAGAVVLGGFLGTQPRRGVLAALRRLPRAAAPLLFLAGLRRIGATQTAVLSLSEPLAATLLAAVILGQVPAPAQLLGAALLVGAGVAVQTVRA